MAKYPDKFRESELLDLFVNGFLTNAAAEFRRLGDGALVDGKQMEFKGQWKRVAAELERLRDGRKP